MGTPQKIQICPGGRMLSILSYFNYKTWFTIAGCVDNPTRVLMKG